MPQERSVYLHQTLDILSYYVDIITTYEDQTTTKAIRE